MSELQLGSTIDHRGQKARVVRFVRSQAIHEPDDVGEPLFILDEYYAELKLEDGMVDFVIFTSEKKLYEGPPSTIPALEYMPWRADR